MIVLVMGIFLVRLFHLQVLSKTYSDLASQNVIRRIQLHAARGLMYDRKGNLIVTNDAVYDLYVVPRQVAKNMDTLLFCKLLQIDREFFNRQMKKAFQYSRYRPSLFLKQITTEEIARFQEYLYQFPGFYTEMRTIRRYPYKSGLHVVGYVGEADPELVETSDYYKAGDYVGINGLEKIYEKELRGVRGSKYILVDVHNREKGSFRNGAMDTFAINGHDLHLSLDIELQIYGEQLMQNKKGSITAIEPATGEILAMISSPSVDPNLLSGRMRGENFRMLTMDTLKPLFNRPVMGFYPPGSTFKPLMALIGLEEKVLTPGTSFRCASGYVVGSFSVGCRPHPPPVNLFVGLQYSCNAYFCSVFRAILDQPRYKNIQESYAVWRNYVTSFGLGNRLGTDIPNEFQGLVPPVEYYNKLYKTENWKSLTIISLGIGQGELAVTPLQLANMTAAIANRGFYYTPHFVTRIEGDTSQRLSQFIERHQTLVSEKNFEPVIEAMYQTVETGTARASRIPGISVCGKTGTAQNPQGEDNSLFLAFAPKDNPKIAIAVVVENAGHGSAYAAPIATLMIEKYLNDTISASRLKLEQKMLEANLIQKPLLP